MRLTIKQDELMRILEKFLDDKVEIESINIEVKTESGFNDYITISEKDYYVGSFIKKEIKEEK